MTLGRWSLGWARNVAIGVLWTRDGRIGIAMLGLFFVRYPSREALEADLAPEKEAP
jgi:hypothetical protein